MPLAQMDSRIGIKNTPNGEVFYAFVNGYDQPEVTGTLTEIEIALGLREAPLSGRPGRRTANDGWVLSFGKIKGNLLVCEISHADSVMAHVSCGKHSCSLSLLSDLGTIGEDGPKVSDEIIEQMEIWAEGKGW